jgi:hypothetical protein
MFCYLTTYLPVNNTEPVMCKEIIGKVKVRIDQLNKNEIGEMNIYCQHELIDIWFMPIFCCQCGLIFTRNQLVSSIEYIPERFRFDNHPMELNKNNIEYKYHIARLPDDILNYLTNRYLVTLPILESLTI